MPAKKSKKSSPKATSQSKDRFARLVEGTESIISYLGGEPVTLKTYRLSSAPKPPVYNAKKVKAVRKKLNVSQPIFAELLNVSKDTVCKWEQDERHPSGPSAKLLYIADKHPEILLEEIAS